MKNSKIEAGVPYKSVKPYECDYVMPIKMVGVGWVVLVVNNRVWWFSYMTKHSCQQEIITKNDKQIMIRYLFESKHFAGADEAWAIEQLGG